VCALVRTPIAMGEQQQIRQRGGISYRKVQVPNPLPSPPPFLPSFLLSSLSCPIVGIANGGKTFQSHGKTFTWPGQDLGRADAPKAQTWSIFQSGMRLSAQSHASRAGGTMSPMQNVCQSSSIGNVKGKTANWMMKC